MSAEVEEDCLAIFSELENYPEIIFDPKTPKASQVAGELVSAQAGCKRFVCEASEFFAKAHFPLMVSCDSLFINSFEV